jgi:hypothetical protein
MLPLIWKVTKQKWLGVVLSALAFGAYHLTPLSDWLPMMIFSS